jgi:hypothetical protein
MPARTWSFSEPGSFHSAFTIGLATLEVFLIGSYVLPSLARLDAFPAQARVDGELLAHVPLVLRVEREAADVGVEDLVRRVVIAGERKEVRLQATSSRSV